MATPSRDTPTDTPSDSLDAARAARLSYVNDDDPGVTRRRAGKGFSYRDPDGRPIRDPAEIARIRSIAIPPAWTDVWISPNPNGHILATGRDDRGRKQYRYHPRWRSVRDDSKYERTLAFADALPRIRKQVRKDLGLPDLPRKKVLATVVALLESTLIRVGNDEYERDNDSFGLTTMRMRHVDVDGAQIRFSFKGKGGKSNEVDIRDRRVARILKRCEELPGQRLFQYVDSEGERRSIDSTDVNDYIREAAGGEFTAKDFRTWAGTLLAARALSAAGSGDDEAAANSNVVRAIEEVAKTLGNTAAVSRQNYVHPAVLDAYLDGSTIRLSARRTRREPSVSDELRPDELAVLKLLRKRLKAEARAAVAAA